MNYEVSFWIFVILTIAHFIGDFGTPYRRWGKGWKQFFLSEWFLVLNPLHALWDAYSPLRRHPQHMEIVKQAYPAIDWEGNTKEGLVIYPLFWRWLAVDQLYHTVSNIMVTLIIGDIIYG